MTLSVCTDAVCPELPVEQAAEMLADLGFTAMEFWGLQGKNLTALKEVCTRRNIRIAGCCTGCFVLNDPTCREEFLSSLKESAATAKRMGIPTLITQVGQDTGAPRAAQHQSIVEGLTAAVPVLQAASVTLVIEPLNLRVNHPGYYMPSSDEAFEIVKEVNSPYVKVLFDIYHQQVTEGDILAHVLPNLEWIGHFHTASCPGRHELESGELCYPRLLKVIADAGYEKFVGLEYSPAGDLITGLKGDLAALQAVGLH